MWKLFLWTYVTTNFLLFYLCIHYLIDGHSLFDVSICSDRLFIIRYGYLLFDGWILGICCGNLLFEEF